MKIQVRRPDILSFTMKLNEESKEKKSKVVLTGHLSQIRNIFKVPHT